MAKHHVDGRFLARCMIRDRFWKSVMTTLVPWREKLSRVNLAVYANAIDSSRKDQWAWIERYYRLCRVPGFEPPKLAPPKPAAQRAAPAPAERPSELMLERPEPKA